MSLVSRFSFRRLVITHKILKIGRRAGLLNMIYKAPKKRTESKKDRDERDFGLETETETRVVSRPVSSSETTSQKSQYQSQNLRTHSLANF